MRSRTPGTGRSTCRRRRFGSKAARWRSRSTTRSAAGCSTGLDDVGVTLSSEAQIADFEAAREERSAFEAVPTTAL